jgi:hypothetical protein
MMHRSMAWSNSGRSTERAASWDPVIIKSFSEPDLEGKIPRSRATLAATAGASPVRIRTCSPHPVFRITHTKIYEGVTNLNAKFS